MFKTNHLTNGERIVLEFLETHPGEKFTPYTIENETGIRSETIPRIVSNLRIKGHNIRMQYGRYWMPNKTWIGWTMLVALFGFLAIIFLITLWEALGRAL